jgi:hypothetical protein
VAFELVAFKLVAFELVAFGLEPLHQASNISFRERTGQLIPTRVPHWRQFFAADCESCTLFN